MTDIASLQLKIDSTQAKTAQSDLENLSKEGEKTEKSLVSMGTAIGVGITSAAVATSMFVKSGIDAADAMNDLHLKTGVALSDLAAYDLLARQSGTDINGIADGFKHLGKYMTEHGDKLKTLGVTSKDQSEAMGQFADVIAGIEDPALRSSLAMEVLGRSGVSLLPALMGGSAAFEEAKNNSKGYGEALEKTAGNADQFNDLMAIGTTKVNQFKTEIAGSLLPLLTEIAKGFTSASVASASMETAFNPLTETLRAITIIGGNVAFVFKGIATELETIGAQIYALSTGDFAGFKALGDAAKRDAEESRKAFDEWEKNVLNAGKLAKAEVNSAADATKRLSDEQESAARKLLSPGKKEKQEKYVESDDEKRYKSVEKLIEAMQREEDIYGKTAAQIKVYDAAKMGANADQMTEIRVMAEVMDMREKERKEAEKAAKDIEKANERSAARIQKIWDDTYAGIQDGIANSVSQSIVYGKDLESALNGVALSIANGFISAWIKIALQKQFVDKSAALAGASGIIAQAQTTSAIAAQNAYASTLLTPGGIFTAPAASAEAFAMAEGMANTISGLAMAAASARDGYDIPAGVNPVTQLHEKEMVLPQAQADVIRGMARNGGAGGQIIDNTVINIDSRSDRMQVMKDVQRMIEAGHSRLVDKLQRQRAIA